MIEVCDLPEILVDRNVDVTFSHLVIQDCQLTGDVPVIVTECESIPSHRVVMSHVDFINNRHPHGAAAVRMNGPSCSILELNAVSFRKNSCNESVSIMCYAF